MLNLDFTNYKEVTLLRDWWKNIKRHFEQVQSAVNANETALSQEMSSRQTADGNLQNAIGNEAQARTNADTELQGNIESEVRTRANAVLGLETRINSAFTQISELSERVDSKQFYLSDLNDGAGRYSAETIPLNKLIRLTNDTDEDLTIFEDHDEYGTLLSEPIPAGESRLLVKVKSSSGGAEIENGYVFVLNNENLNSLVARLQRQANGTVSSSPNLSANTKYNGMPLSDMLGDTPMISITHDELLTKVNAGELIPGQQYRITDYVTTTAQANTQSAGHSFDIIVTADNATTLNENARAVMHDGDTYFANSNLAAWKLKYDINNDTTKYAWADSTDGKGVIYELEDEFGNRCGYDFKNIQYKCMKITATTTGIAELVGSYSATYRYDSNTRILPSASDCTTDTEDYVWRYTFNFLSNNEQTDYSIISTAVKFCCRNVITVQRNPTKRYLPFIVFSNAGNRPLCNDNIIGNNSYNIIFGSACHDNQFKGTCYEIIFRDNCYANLVGYNCSDLLLGTQAHENSFGESSSGHRISDSCRNNIFGKGTEAIILSSNCANNTFGAECIEITLGIGDRNNTFGQSCLEIETGTMSSYNEFGAYCTNIQLGNICMSNKFRGQCFYVTMGDNISNNDINTSYKTIPLKASTAAIVGDTTAMTLSETVTYTNSGTDTLSVDVTYCFKTASGKLLSGTQTVTLPVGDTSVTFTENISKTSDATGAKFTSSNVYKLGEADITFRVMRE